MPQPSLGKSRSSCQKARQQGNGRETHIHGARKAAALGGGESGSRGPGEPRCNCTGRGGRRKGGFQENAREHGIPAVPWICVPNPKLNVPPASSPGTHTFLDGSKTPRGNLTKELSRHRRGGPGPRAKSQSRSWVTFPTAPPGPRPHPHPYRDPPPQSRSRTRPHSPH